MQYIIIINHLLNRRRKSGKGDLTVSANMAYADHEINLEAIKAAEAEKEEEREGEGEGEGEGECMYEDPDNLVRGGQHFRGRHTPAVEAHSASPYELPVNIAETNSSSSAPPAGPAGTYATADEVSRSWKDTKIVDAAAEASQYY